MTTTVTLSQVTLLLASIVGPEHCLTGAATEAFATDVYRHLALPQAVVRPATVSEVQAVVRALAQLGISLTIRGGGASYTDGYLSGDPQHVLVDLGRLNHIVEIDEINGYVTVEAGVTWAELKAVLAERGLRTPFWGPFSGLAATIGGSVSQHSISHGSGAYGISAQSVQALDLVLADGTLLRTGAGMLGGKPFARHFGPDLTGLFTGDCGTLGIKVRITLPVLRGRPAHRPISFAFAEFDAMHEAMRRIGLERLEDTHFAIDSALSQGQIARQDTASNSLKLATSILKSSPSLASGLREVVLAGLATRRLLQTSAYMVHYIVEGLNDAEVRARLHRMRRLVQGLGREIPATVPSVVRALPFAPLYNTLGPSGERWVPVHGILPHSATPGFHRALEDFYGARTSEMKQLGVWTGGMYATVGSSGFLYEIAIYWPDAITAYHRHAVPADYLTQLPTYADNPIARDYVQQLKADLIALYDDHGAIHFQLGRAYPFTARLEAPAAGLLAAIKHHLDPELRLAPRALA
jgi:D-lactate dehydrogenase (cytochrome)